MSGTDGPGKGRIEDAAALRQAVAEVARDLKLLSSRVAELSAAAQAVAAAGEGTEGRPAARPAPAGKTPRSRMEAVTVTVRPLPELAMAAMAETSLRGLPGVHQVLSVERFDDWARFSLEVVRGTDLITEMRAALPVAFKSEQAEDGEISLALKWAWGTAQ